MDEVTSDVKTFILGQYASLLLSLGLMVVLQPAANTVVGGYLIEVMFVVTLFAGLRAVQIRKTMLRFLCLLLLANLTCIALGFYLDLPALYAFGVGGRIIFLSLVAFTILYDLFTTRKVTADTLAGAVCIYLLIACIWAYAYMLSEFFVPESFSFTEAHGMLELWLSKEFYPFLYFSLVTMTTVGYGDMSPVSELARTLATTEAIVGQMYLTILVARLVGMHLVSSGSNADSNINAAEGDR